MEPKWRARSLRRGLANVTDTQRENEAVQLGLACCRQRTHDTGRRFFTHAVERRKLLCA